MIFFWNPIIVSKVMFVYWFEQLRIWRSLMAIGILLSTPIFPPCLELGLMGKASHQMVEL